MRGDKQATSPGMHRTLPRILDAGAYPITCQGPALDIPLNIRKMCPPKKGKTKLRAKKKTLRPWEAYVIFVTKFNRP